MQIAWLVIVFIFSSLVCGTTIGQTVQLPTLHSFSTSGTVLVPDQGGAFLGGVSRAATGSASRRLPGVGGIGSSFGRQVSSGTASVHVTIIDHQQLDQEVLAAAKRGRGVEQVFAPSFRPSPYELGRVLRQHDQGHSGRRGVGIGLD